MALSHRQQAFIENYTGNATEAAKLAGYSEATAYSSGQRLLKQPQIAEAIRAREQERQAPNIANREQRLAFWTAVMRDPDESTRDRLRASELLAKAQGDFLIKIAEESETHIDLTAAVRLVLLERDAERQRKEEY
ncbi:MAG: terminase small subunit [Synergistaceae bacterium]|nr:terminase small subunit [Synergistaceae bacterium]MBR0221815.1 terminase small subunit [Synergistaceae bacterium]